MDNEIYKRKERSTHKPIYRVECWFCGHKHSNILKHCPRCKTKNEDYQGFNGFNYPQKDEENY